MRMADVLRDQTRLTEHDDVLSFFLFYPPLLKSSSDPKGIAPAHYHHQGPSLHTHAFTCDARTGSLNILAADHEELSRYKGPPI